MSAVSLMIPESHFHSARPTFSASNSYMYYILGEVVFTRWSSLTTDGVYAATTTCGVVRSRLGGKEGGCQYGRDVTGSHGSTMVYPSCCLFIRTSNDPGQLQIHHSSASLVSEEEREQSAEKDAS